mgnify:FL=1
MANGNGERHYIPGEELARIFYNLMTSGEKDGSKKEEFAECLKQAVDTNGTTVR